MAKKKPSKSSRHPQPKKLVQPVREFESEDIPQAVGGGHAEEVPQAVGQFAEGARADASDLDGANLPQAVTEIPWGQDVVLIETAETLVQRVWSAEQTIQNGRFVVKADVHVQGSGAPAAGDVHVGQPSKAGKPAERSRGEDTN